MSPSAKKKKKKKTANPHVTVSGPSRNVTSDTENKELHEREEKERQSKAREKNPMRVHLEYKEGCEHAKDLLHKLKERIPKAKITTEVSQEDVFEFLLNEKVVYSRTQLGGYPDNAEMVEIAFWMNKGKSFMHMYLCTFVEGGEPKMVIADRKSTPLAKRVILACTIS